MYIIVAISTFHAERHPIDRGIGRAGDTDNFAVTHIQVEITAHPTVGASGPHFAHLVGPTLSHTHFVIERPHRAEGHTLPTALAAGVQ